MRYAKLLAEDRVKAKKSTAPVKQAVHIRRVSPGILGGLPAAGLDDHADAPNRADKS